MYFISSVRTDDESGEIFLHLEYKLDYVEVEGVRYPIYDFRKARVVGVIWICGNIRPI